MSGFLYFVESESKSITLDRLKEVGLGYIFETESDYLVRSVMENGPGETGRGVIVASKHNVDTSLLGFFKDKQCWQSAPGLKGVWIGRTLDLPPMPVDLERPNTISGHMVKLGDEREWLIPVALLAAKTVDEQLTPVINLPTKTGLNEDSGKWEKGGVIQKHEVLWKKACEFWDSMLVAIPDSLPEGKPSFVEVEFENKHDTALLALQCNYLIDKSEIAMLELFNSDSVDLIIGALIDLPAIKAFAKKKVLAGMTKTTSTNVQES